MSGVITFRCAPEEHDVLREQAALSNKSINQLIRIRLGFPKKPDPETAKEIAENLRTWRSTIPTKT